MPVIETVWDGRDNVAILQLFDDSGGALAAADLSETTKIELVEGETVIATSTTVGAFDWADGNGVLRISLGSASLALRPYKCKLVIYNTSSVNGTVWGEVTIVVRK